MLARVRRAHELNHGVSPLVDPETLRRDLEVATYWTVRRGPRLVGHVAGAVSEDDGVTTLWSGLDGISFDDDDALDALLRRAARVRHQHGASRWSVTVADHPVEIAPWIARGFRLTRRTGACVINPAPTAPPAGVDIERSNGDARAHLARASSLVDAARGVSAHPAPDEGAATLVWVARAPHVIGVVGAFERLDQRGVFPGTWHLTTVAVEPDARRHGVGRALVGVAMAELLGRGIPVVDVTWDPRDPVAERFWTRLGFVGATVVLSRDN